jgi:hypothetical protein
MHWNESLCICTLIVGLLLDYPNMTYLHSELEHSWTGYLKKNNCVIKFSLALIAMKIWILARKGALMTTYYYLSISEYVIITVHNKTREVTFSSCLLLQHVCIKWIYNINETFTSFQRQISYSHAANVVNQTQSHCLYLNLKWRLFLQSRYYLW